MVEDPEVEELFNENIDHQYDAFIMEEPIAEQKETSTNENIFLEPV